MSEELKKAEMEYQKSKEALKSYNATKAVKNTDVTTSKVEKTNDKVTSTQIKKLNEKKLQKDKKKKKRLIRTGILILVAGTALGSFFLLKNKKNNTQNDTEIVNDIGLDDLGDELSTESTNDDVIVTGDVDPNKVVEKNGKVYVDQEAADKADSVGESIDTNNGEYYVTDSGKVKTKTEGYEVKDSDGNVVSKGNGEVPDGYAYDSNLGTYVEESEVGKNVKLESDYYDDQGNLVFSKGDVVSKETYEEIKNDTGLHTTKPTTVSAPKMTSSTQATQATQATKSTSTQSNSSYYEIYNMKFESKDDYEQWVIQGYTGYSEVDGIMMSDAAREEYSQSLRK